MRPRTIAAVVVTLAALLAGFRVVADQQTDSGVRRQLAFLRDKLDDGAAERAQQLFPEGYFFSYVLYGLAQVDQGNAAEAEWALGKLEEPAGHAPFDPALTPRFGIFYQGWINWLRGGIVMLDGEDSILRYRFEAATKEIARAFDASTTPYLQAYPGQAWPVDSTVAVASLQLYDKMLAPRYGAVIERWLAGVQSRLDPATGLLPHTVDPASGVPTSVARGSSQSIIQRFLYDIDPTFAREQYLLFRSAFVTRPLGLGPAVLEYPAGTSGTGDADSGPLVLGASLSASTVTLGAARVQGDAGLAAALANYGELLGVPVEWTATKRYAGGLLPLGDAFLAWSKSAKPWVSPPAPDLAPAFGWWWRLPLLSACWLAVLLAWIPALRRRRPPAPPKVIVLDR